MIFQELTVRCPTFNRRLYSIRDGGKKVFQYKLKLLLFIMINIYSKSLQNEFIDVGINFYMIFSD